MFSRKIRKFDFCLSLIFAIGLILIFISRYQGIDFPKEHELKYSTGVFSMVKQSKATNYVRLSQINGGGNSMVYSCAYSPFGNGESSSCGSKKSLEPYANKMVTGGWYEQPEFLGFKNEMPQLVTIEIDGEVMRSYAERETYIKELQRIYLYFLLPGSMLCFPLFYWAFGKMTAYGERNRK